VKLRFMISAAILPAFIFLLSGCSSTGKQKIEKLGLEQYSAPQSFSYLRLVNKKFEYIYFHIDKKGIFIDDRKDIFTNVINEKFKDKDVVSDCILIKEGAFNLCDKNGFLRPGSIFESRELNNVVDGTLGVAVGVPLAILGSAVGILTLKNPIKSISGSADGLSRNIARPVIDQETIDKVGKYIVYTLYTDYEKKKNILISGINQSNINIVQIQQFAEEFPNSANNKEFLGAAFKKSIDANDVSDINQLITTATNLHNENTKYTLFNALSYAIQIKNIDIARAIYSTNEANKLVMSDTLKNSYKELVLEKGDFNDMYAFAQVGDKDALRKAYDLASSDQEKKKIEYELIRAIGLDKMLVVTTHLTGLGDATASSSSVYVFGASISSNLTSKIDYSIAFNTALFKPKYTYVIEAKAKVVATGEKRWSRNCGFLWMDTCEEQDKNATMEYPKSITGTLAANSNVVGGVKVDWNPRVAKTGLMSGNLMGNPWGFSTREVTSKVSDITLKPIN